MPGYKRAYGGGAYGYSKRTRPGPYLPARRRYTRSVRKTGITRIVKKTINSMAEKKRARTELVDQSVGTNGVNISFPALAMGSGSDQRVGREVSWTSYFLNGVLQSNPSANEGAQVRVICYSAKNGTDVITDFTTPTITSFLDTDKFIIHSDKLLMVSEYGKLNHAMQNSVKVFKRGKKFKSPKTVKFLNSTTAKPIAGDMHWFLVSNQPASILNTITNLNIANEDCPKLTLRADYWYTDA